MGPAIELKSPGEMDRMREAGRLLAQVFDRVLAAVAPGVTTAKLDQIAADVISAGSARPAFLNYNGFPATICASVDEQVVHGIPDDQPLAEGQIIGIDIGLSLDGLFSDRATTVTVGRVAPDVMRLIRVTRQCLERGIEAAQVGNRLEEIGRAVQTLAESEGFSVVREYSGHGIGRRLHEPPQIPNFVSGRGGGANPRLRAGMAIAIEPMINQGIWKTKTLDDRWTVVTADGLPSAHFEHTVLVTEAGPEVVTGTHPPLEEMELDTLS